MSLRCTTDRYDALYARWLTNPGSLLDLAGYKPGDRLLDLCGGTGAVSLEALRRGADPGDITLLDLNPRCPDKRVSQIGVDLDQLGTQFWLPRMFDVIICRQAISYLDLKQRLVHELERCLAPDGKFVFNTFAKPRWTLKTYKHEGRRFFEASGYSGKTVYHVQASPGLGLDVSRFHWYTKGDLFQALGSSFEIEVRESGKSAHWICTPRREA